MDLDDEKKEHELFLDATKDLEASRKCQRMIGGVLVERTLAEVIPAIRQNIEMINKASSQYAMIMQNKEKELINFELKYYQFYMIDMVLRMTRNLQNRKWSYLIKQQEYQHDRIYNQYSIVISDQNMELENNIRQIDDALDGLRTRLQNTQCSYSNI